MSYGRFASGADVRFNISAFLLRMADHPTAIGCNSSLATGDAIRGHFQIRREYRLKVETGCITGQQSRIVAVPLPAASPHRMIFLMPFGLPSEGCRLPVGCRAMSVRLATDKRTRAKVPDSGTGDTAILSMEKPAPAAQAALTNLTTRSRLFHCASKKGLKIACQPLIPAVLRVV